MKLDDFSFYDYLVDISCICCFILVVLVVVAVVFCVVLGFFSFSWRRGFVTSKVKTIKATAQQTLLKQQKQPDNDNNCKKKKDKKGGWG